MHCLSIHLTDLCNSQCSFCVVASPLYTENSVEFTRVCEFLEENRGAGFDVVNLHGGEPAIHPQFEEVLALIRDLGYPEVHLQTNGIILAKEKFATRCVELGVTKFIISLHGDSPEIQDSQTYTTGGFTRTVHGIANVKALGAHVRTNTVISLQNVERLTATMQLACDLGVDHLNLSNLHPVGSARFSLDRILPSLRCIAPFISEAVDLGIAAGRRVTLEGFPYCALPGMEDLHLNNEFRLVRMLMRGQVIENYDAFMSDSMRIFGEMCGRCTARDLCGGVYKEYIAYNGWEEFKPLRCRPITKESGNALREMPT